MDIDGTNAQWKKRRKKIQRAIILYLCVRLCKRDDPTEWVSEWICVSMYAASICVTNVLSVLWAYSMCVISDKRSDMMKFAFVWLFFSLHIYLPIACSFLHFLHFFLPFFNEYIIIFFLLIIIVRGSSISSFVRRSYTSMFDNISFLCFSFHFNVNALNINFIWLQFCKNKM